MKKKLAALVTAAAFVGLPIATAAPASANQAWINGWVGSSSTCSTYNTPDCKIVIFTGGTGWAGANQTTVWIHENSPVYNCTKYGIVSGARLGASGVLAKLEGPYTTVPNTNGVKAGAYVTIQYGSSDPEYTRC